MSAMLTQFNQGTVNISTPFCSISYLDSGSSGTPDIGPTRKSQNAQSKEKKEREKKLDARRRPCWLCAHSRKIIYQCCQSNFAENSLILLFPADIVLKLQNLNRNVIEREGHNFFFFSERV